MTSDRVETALRASLDELLHIFTDLPAARHYQGQVQRARQALALAPTAATGNEEVERLHMPAPEPVAVCDGKGFGSSCRHRALLKAIAVEVLDAGGVTSGDYDSAAIVDEVRVALARGVGAVDEALTESVKLQSHYAGILNGYDGGKRMQFKTAQGWIDRLAALKGRG